MHLDSLSGPELVKVYNEAALKLDRPPVTRFSDRKTALRRTAEIQAVLDSRDDADTAFKPSDQAASSAAEEHLTLTQLVAKRTRRPGFNFPALEKRRAMRNGTLRSLVAERMRGEGATFAELEDVVDKFDRSKGKEPSNTRDRAYGAVRLLHFYCGFGVREVGDRLLLIEQ